MAEYVYPDTVYGILDDSSTSGPMEYTTFQRASGEYASVFFGLDHALVGITTGAEVFTTVA